MTRSFLAFGLSAAFLLGGCVPNKTADVRKAADPSIDSAVAQASYNRAADEAKRSDYGRIIAPKRYGLRLATLVRPVNDPALNQVLWRAADEQFIPTDLLRSLEANGIRVGLISGNLPPQIEAILTPPPPGKKLDIATIDLPDGEPMNVDLAKSIESLTLLLNRDGRTFGKDYQDAKGFLRVSATQNGTGGVQLRVVPEIHHGPIRQGFGVAPSASPLQPQEFLVKSGQAEESFRELAATVEMNPGQILVVGGRAEMSRGLGGFLFLQNETNSDRVEQKVLLIWAEPSASVAPASNATRENLLIRLNDAIKANQGKPKTPPRP